VDVEAVPEEPSQTHWSAASHGWNAGFDGRLDRIDHPVIGTLMVTPFLSY
jgi:hypothetical protein